jgi:hypothetical protein
MISIQPFTVSLSLAGAAGWDGGSDVEAGRTEPRTIRSPRNRMTIRRGRHFRIRAGAPTA